MHVYFRVLEDIAPNTELLVWYGNEYAKELGLIDETVLPLQHEVTVIYRNTARGTGYFKYVVIPQPFKLINLVSYGLFNSCKKKLYFYYTTIAYHVGLNAVLRWPHHGQRRRKKDISC